MKNRITVMMFGLLILTVSGVVAANENANGAKLLLPGADTWSNTVSTNANDASLTLMGVHTSNNDLENAEGAQLALDPPLALTQRLPLPPVTQPDRSLGDVGPLLNTMLAALLAEYGVTSTDLDGDGVPDTSALALLVAAGADDTNPSLRDAAQTAFEVNLAWLAAEPEADALEQHREILAALMSLSEGMHDALVAMLETKGVQLAGDYTPVACADGTCMPTVVNNEYLVYDNTVVASEPFSGDGDLDADGHSNLEEYNNTMATSGNPDYFVISAVDDTRAGNESVSDMADLDRNGRCDASDVQAIINAVLASGGVGYFSDVTLDGQVNASDVQMVINVALGKYTE